MSNQVGISFFEIPAVDFKRAVAFYNALLGLTLHECDWGEEKMAFFPEMDGGISGAVSLAPDFTPSENGPIIYFNADERLDEMQANVAALGGEIIREKTQIDGDKGEFALIKDTEGNRIGLYAR